MEKYDKLELEKQEEILSVCEIMKDDASKAFRKMESQIPLLFQNYSNLYTRYPHMLDYVFGTCYVTEKEFFDRLNIDQGVLRQVKENSKSLKNNHIQDIEMLSAYFDKYIKMRIDVIKSFDNYTHVMMDFYAKMFSQFNKFF